MNSEPGRNGGTCAPLFVERQKFDAWVYITLVVVLLPSLAAPVAATVMAGESAKILTCALILLVALLNLFVLNLLCLRTRVDTGTVFTCLGWAFPVVWKRLPLTAIVSLHVVQYRPIRDAGGWGMRFGRFQGRGTTFWNARGNLGVLIVTAKRPYVIGSQHPDQLHAAIETARAALRSG